MAITVKVGDKEVDVTERVKRYKDAPDEVALEMQGWLTRFHEIEEKNKCLRVQFLDWLSDKLLDWSNKCHVASVKIDSPCVLKVEPRKKEESRDAKERKQVAQLKEDLERLRTQNEKLWADRRAAKEEAKEVAQ